MPFLWAHGLMSSMAVEEGQDWFKWGSFPTQLKLVRYDARGHGKSQATRSYRDYLWPNLGKDMLAIADAVGAERFIAGGGSLGSATALYAALQAPQRVARLVLFGPPLAWEERRPEQALFYTLALAGGVFGGKSLAYLIQRLNLPLFPEWLTRDERQSETLSLEAISAYSARTLRPLLLGAAKSDLPPPESLKPIENIPTLIATLSGDKTHPERCAERLHKAMKLSVWTRIGNHSDLAKIPLYIAGFCEKLLIA